MRKIGLGTVQFGLDYGISNQFGQTNLEEVGKILNLATANNISIIDTAFAYGQSQEILGFYPLQNFKVVSKFINVSSNQELLNQFNTTLKQLKLKKLYGYIAHRPLEVIHNQNLWEELKGLKEKGEISKIGFSFNNVEEVEEVIENKLIPDLIQAPYNYFDKRFEKYFKFFKNEYNTEIHTRSTFLQGLFFMDLNDLPNFFKPIEKILNELQKDNNLNSQLLDYVCGKDFIDNVIIGVNNSAQLSSNINFELVNFCKLVDLNYEIPNEILTPSMWKI